MTRIAALTIAFGAVLVSVGVGLYDYRAGIVLFGICLAVAGVWHLTTQE